MSFFVETLKPKDWAPKLADPKHWKKGYSARTLANSWMNAKGFPKSIEEVFQKSDYKIFNGIDFLLGIVEHKVPLGDKFQPSQNDIFVLAKNNKDLISIAVEGKVSEPFGERIREWLIHASEGKNVRLKFLSKLLQLDNLDLNEIRYQLLHRTASALIEAKRFNASAALMLVHSFSPINEGFDDYKFFAESLGEPDVKRNCLHFIKKIGDIELYLGWVTGDEKYRNM